MQCKTSPSRTPGPKSWQGGTVAFTCLRLARPGRSAAPWPTWPKLRAKEVGVRWEATRALAIYL